MAERGVQAQLVDSKQGNGAPPEILRCKPHAGTLDGRTRGYFGSGFGALTINLAASLAADGIRVNTVAPATIRTRNWDGQEGGADRFRDLYPLGRVGEPEDVASAVAFLASSDAGWITGHTLPVDGGLMTGARMTWSGRFI